MTQKDLFITLQKVVPHHKLSRFTAMFAQSRNPLVKTPLIRVFSAVYGVNLQEALYSRPADYASFNDFFTRPLKPGARPLADPGEHVLCPVDGAVSQLGDIHQDRIFQAKGFDYTLSDLLGHSPHAGDFEGGTFATIYLAPRDYHRIHMPCLGTPIESLYLPGDLYSVNPTTAQRVPRLFARNERLSAIFDTPHGKMALVLVGAMIVAGIDTVWGQNSRRRQAQLPDQPLQAGQEMGRFYLGSTIVLLFQNGAQSWLPEYGPESVTRLGQALGRWS